MCNYRGELSECSQANFFMVRGGTVLTPRSEAGLLEGITRAFLFEVGKDIGVDVQEVTLFPNDLATADEAFITSTTRELSPVTRIDDRPVGTGKVGPITKPDAGKRVSEARAGDDVGRSGSLIAFRKAAPEVSVPT